MTTDLATRAAGLFTVGFPGRSVGPELARLLDLGVGGVVFFSRNVGTPEEVFELTSAIRRAAARPLVLAVDQEGGAVARLRQGFTTVPPMRVLGRTADEGLAFEIGALLGRELRAVGFDMNYAPVLDVDTNPDNPVIGSRSLGRDPELVARLGVALARGLQASGVAACGKHFPGHGDTSQDSHLTLPRLPHSLERLRAVELVPFAAAVEAGIAAIMTAHVVFEALDAERPATMSAPVLGLLREELGYDGVVVSDDVEMRAIADHFGVEDAVVRGLNAGVDQFLCCHTADLAERAIRAVVRAVEQGVVTEARLSEAHRRNLELCRRFEAPPDPISARSVPGCAEHLALIGRLSASGGTASGAVADPTEAAERRSELRGGRESN